MGLFNSITELLTGSVGNNLENNPDDIRKTKQELNKTGFFNGDIEGNFITQDLDSSIKDFQKDKDLKIDGLIFPKGETEQTLFGVLSNNINDLASNNIGFGGNVLGTFVPIKAKPNKADKPFTFAQLDSLTKKPEKRPQIDSIKKLQEQQDNDKSTSDNDAPVKLDATGRIIRNDITLAPIPKKKPDDLPLTKGLNNKAIIADIKREEDTTAYLYKDTAKGGGKVTIGTGHLLINAEKAKKLPFTLPDGKGGRRKATPGEIESSFKKIESIKQPKTGEKHTANSFNPSNTNPKSMARTHDLVDIQLPKEEVTKLLKDDLRIHASELRKKIPKFDDLPKSAKQGLIDLQFNLGGNEFNREKWPKLFNAINKRDWKIAAEQSHRKDGGHAGMVGRNARVKDKFLDAIKEGVK